MHTRTKVLIFLAYEYLVAGEIRAKKFHQHWKILRKLRLSVHVPWLMHAKIRFNFCRLDPTLC